MREREFPYKQITFAVNQTFKGTSTATVRLATGFGGGDCGYAFETGQTYVVYARGEDDALLLVLRGLGVVGGRRSGAVLALAGPPGLPMLCAPNLRRSPDAPAARRAARRSK